MMDESSEESGEKGLNGLTIRVDERTTEMAHYE